MNASTFVRAAFTAAALAASAKSPATDATMANLAVGKAASDVMRASAAACGAAPRIDQLRGAFAEAGAGLPLVASVYTRAPFAGAQAAGLAGPGVTLDEAWQSVQNDARARASFEAWRDADYDAAVSRVATGLCAQAAGKR